MDLNRLHEIIEATTKEFRKGKAVIEKRTSGLKVTEIYAMPHETKIPPELEKVDCHFIIVGVDKKIGEPLKNEIKHILQRYPSPERLAGGPSYIEVGAEVGSQDVALRLFALGKVLGLWDIITPEKLGIKGKEADELAGSGFVMITGFKNE